MKLLFVCAGNIMRSVVSECVLRARADDALGGNAALFVAESAGLEADDDVPAHPKAQAALAHLGLPSAQVTSSPLDEEMMSLSDLAVTMTRQQSYQLAGRFPSQKRKCFSLIELNGAIETLLDWKGVSLDGTDWAAVARGLDTSELESRLEAATSELTSAPRELLRPLPGTRLNVRDLMTLFASCFYHVSGVQDPVSGTEADMLACARLIDSEVTALLRGLLALALA